MRPAAAIAMIALLPLSSAFADVYRSIDAQGHVLYSDTPTPGAQLVHTTGSQHVPFNSATDTLVTTAKAATPPAPKVGDAAHDIKVEQATLQVQSDVAQTRAEQCKKAQDTYDKQVLARRIYSVGADGERTYLSDDEAEKQRINSKLQVDELCKDI